MDNDPIDVKIRDCHFRQERLAEYAAAINRLIALLQEVIEKLETQKSVNKRFRSASAQ